MPNKNSPNLYINHVSLSNDGSYYCRFCNQDNYCATSNSAELTISGMLF